MVVFLMAGLRDFPAAFCDAAFVANSASFREVYKDYREHNVMTAKCFTYVALCAATFALAA